MNKTITVKCQSCNKNDVIILENHPYFGILCSECSKRHPFTLSNNTNKSNHMKGKFEETK